jgi:hypothetical protein
MKFCKDCRWFKEGHGKVINGECYSPLIQPDLLSGIRKPRDARMNRYLEISGCGEQAKWFSPKVDCAELDAEIEKTFNKGVE